MSIAVIGSGYVGLTTAVMFCELGHKVICVDNDERKLKQLKQGKIPIYEPGLEDLLIKHYQQQNISYTSKIEQAIEACSIIYITVGTPAAADGSSDLKYVKEVAHSIGTFQENDKIVVTKSTVPVGTGEKVQQWIAATQNDAYKVEVVSNPEFLREGSAILDAMQPDRIIIGSNSLEAANIIKDLFDKIDAPKIITNLRTAELIKYTANAFLAMKISFINEISRLCDVYQVNVNDVALGIGKDARIGHSFLRAGIGWGGSCFPKDIASLLHMSKQANLESLIIHAVMQVNKEQINYYIEQLENRLGSMKGKNISILGIAFKPDTDDIRESPAIKVIQILVEAGANIRVYDPIALKHFEYNHPHIVLCSSPEETAIDSDALLLMTEWQEIMNMDWQKVYQVMRNPLIMDGRNVLNQKELKQLGFSYYGAGVY